MLQQTSQTGILDFIKTFRLRFDLPRCSTAMSKMFRGYFCSPARTLCRGMLSSVSLIICLIIQYSSRYGVFWQNASEHLAVTPATMMFRRCHWLSYNLLVHKVYHLSGRVIRCRIYTGLSIGMSIEGHLASIIRRINAIFQPWIPGNDSFQINGAKRNTTLLGER